MPEKIFRIGVVGAGEFAAFAIQAFRRVEGIEVDSVTDTNPDAANRLASLQHLRVFNSYEEMLADVSIDIIYIATPPFLHYQQSKMALLAGKQVICEKPAALKVSEAEELIRIAASENLLYVVNLMQRYNPLYEKIIAVIEGNSLGDFLHGYFENYASDENLPDAHWFWDETKSGGIFIEHCVHFFDLFSGWLGAGRVEQSFQIENAAGNIDRVQATVMYKPGPVNFYHGFNQPRLLDRQELRLQFSFGEITLSGWIPLQLKLYALVKNLQLEYLQHHFENASIVYHKTGLIKNAMGGKYRDRLFDAEITLHYNSPSDKQTLYGEMISAMLSDQVAWIRDHAHMRIIDEQNALYSLKMAEDATKVLKKIRL